MKALRMRKENTQQIEKYSELKEFFSSDSGFAESPWCGSAECESKVKEETKATIRILLQEQSSKNGEKCVFCGEEAKETAVFAKAY